MKGIRLVYLVIAMLVGVVSLSGCGAARAPVVRNSIDDLILAADDAVRYAAQAKAAQQAASELSDGVELRALLDKADEAARNAQQAADEAALLQRQIDDLAAREEAMRQVLRAQQAAEEAAAQTAAINRILLLTRKTVINSRMDEVTNSIAQQVDFTGSSSQQEQIAMLDEIVAGSFCDLLVDTAATGEAPTPEEVLAAVQENAANSIMDISDVYDVVSEELMEKFNQWVIGQPVDELQLYKDACSSVLSER